MASLNISRDLYDRLLQKAAAQHTSVEAAWLSRCWINLPSPRVMQRGKQRHRSARPHLRRG